ncbi:hypothetical protein VTL71DRAFT_12159 [Oculimacula yallundae]|uniref:Uncharacterized protein n=1 Tax=Oculimacula yallundae TaxID=86028 RepID=A0ABR4CTR4_9HELO
MVAFRGLAWPYKTESTRIDRSDLSVTKPSSPAEIDIPSVQDLVVQLETKEEEAHRRSSVGDRPSTPNFRAHPHRPVILHSRTPSPHTVSKIGTLPKDLLAVREEAGRGLKARSISPELDFKAVPLVFITADGEIVQHPYFLLATPGGSEDIGSETNSSHISQPSGEEEKQPTVDLENLPPLPDSPFTFSQSPRAGTRNLQNRTEEISPLASPLATIQPIAPLSPLNIALASAADPTPTPSEASRPETPLSFYHLDPSSAATFNTSVRDLIQEAPDNPIGGQPPATMNEISDVKSQRSKSSKKSSKKRRALNSRSNNSDHKPNLSGKDHETSMSPEPFANLENLTKLSPRPATPSELSLKMVTAPDTPTFGRRNEFSDMSDISFDGHGSVTEVKDFALQTKATENTEENAEDSCPDCDPPEGESTNALNGQSLPATPSGLPGTNLPSPCLPTSKSLPNGLPATSVLPSAVPAHTMSSDGLPMTNIPPNSIPAGEVSAPGALPDTAIPQPGSENFYVPGSNISRGLAVPADITGKLDPPSLPTPSKKRVALGKGKRKGQKVIRRGRSLILRKSVLSVVIGRQLAGPTSSALKLVGKGVPVDPGALKDAAAVPAAPVPAVPAPTTPLPA